MKPSSPFLAWTLLLLSSALPSWAAFIFSGTLHSVVVDSNRTLMWGIRDGGTPARSQSVLYRSRDQGKTWQGLPYQNIQASTTPLYSVVVGRSGTVFVLTSKAGGYLWSSTDGGVTWQNPGANFQNAEVNANLGFGTGNVLVGAAPSALVYVQTGVRLFRSRDAGATFDTGLNTPCSNGIWSNPADPRRLACANRGDGFLYFSTDEGTTWTRGAAPGGTIEGCTLLSDPRDADTYWGECLDLEPGGQADKWFRSTDSLRTLTPAAAPVSLPFFSVSPDHSLILAIGFGGFRSSRDLGVTWQALPGGISSTDAYGFDPADANIVYQVGTARSTDGAATFVNLNPAHVPLLIPSPPLQVTLESGTAYAPKNVLRDPFGDLFTVSSFSFERGTPVDASWIQTDVGEITISAVGLDTGSYQAAIPLATSGELAGQLEIQLTVVARRDPPIFLKVNRIAGTGVIVAETGTPGPFAGDGGPAIASALVFPSAVTVDPSGNVYVASASRVRRITPNGAISTFAGTGVSGSTGDGGLATAATFSFINDLLWTADGLLIKETSKIRLVRPNGVVELFYPKTAGTQPSMIATTNMALDSAGNLYIASRFERIVYRLQANGTFLTAFNATSAVPAINGVTLSLLGIAIDRRNDSFILALEDRILRRDALGRYTLLAGTPAEAGFTGDGAVDASGSRIFTTGQAVVDSLGNVYFDDIFRIRVILANGGIGTVAGNGAKSSRLDSGVLANSGGLRPGHMYAQPDDRVVVTDGVDLLLLTRTAAPASRISAGGVVTLGGRARISPGAIFSIYGLQLAGSVISSPVPPLQTKLGDTEVQVNGVAIPLFFVSATQINAQLPYNVPLGTARVRVLRNGVATGEESVLVVAVAPDVLLYGAGRAVAVNQDFSINGESTPAPVGSFVVLYLTGIGPVDPATTAGVAASTDPLSRATLPSSITLTAAVGQNVAPVTIKLLFLGLTPTYAGLVQANFQVPNLPPGDYTLVLTVGGEASNPVKLAVGP
ncbi:MAG: hypothetical protein ABI811_02835 [Acidobacteriota bacterium]